VFSYFVHFPDILVLFFRGEMLCQHVNHYEVK